MKRNLRLALLILPAVLVLLALPAQAETVKGQVVQVHQRTQNQGEFNELTIRTREGKDMRLRLGDGNCDNCPKVGDQVRARLVRQDRQKSGDGSCREVRDLRNNTTGSVTRLRDRRGDRVGDLDRSRQHDRLSSGSGQQSRGQSGGQGGGSGGSGSRGGGHG